MNEIALLGIHFDANLSKLDAKATELYDPTIRILYVRISQRFNLIQKALIRQRLRKVFKCKIEMQSVSDQQIKILLAFYHWTLRKETHARTEL